MIRSSSVIAEDFALVLAEELFKTKNYYNERLDREYSSKVLNLISGILKKEASSKD